jgi:hypothetical protein
MSDEEELPFRVTSAKDEVWVQLRPRTGVLADVPDPGAAEVVWHRLTPAEATALRDELTAALKALER